MNKVLSFNTYTSLHVHTAKGSIGDSTLKINEYIEKAKKLGIKSLAITNHGSLADIFEFYHECKANDIKPIIGCEVYETEDRLLKDKDHSNYWHLVLIAKNEVGFRNLLQITTEAQLNGFYYKPRTDISYLKDHGEGIIALTACVAGKIPQLILSGSEKEMIESKIEEYKNIFDSVYLEIQPGNFDEQEDCNNAMIYLSKETNTPLVLTNDVHYLNKDDWRAHDIHVRMGRKQSIEGELIYPDTCYYFMDYKEILSLPSVASLPTTAVISAVNNSAIIASSVHLSLDIDKIHMPIFNVPPGYTEESYLGMLCYKKLDEIKDEISDPAAYVSRVEYELETICDLGFAGYFLIVRDYIKYALDNDIAVGPGRGSICGSLVAYLVDITKIDPIKYNLLFERFLSKYRKGSVPDIDCDFQADRRQEIFDYVVSKYGKERCALVSTFGIRKARAALRDTARVFGIDKDTTDFAAKLIPQVYYDDNGDKTTDLSIADSLEIVSELRDIQQEFPEWFEMAMKLEDLPGHTSIHAAGTLIAPVDLSNYIPLIKPKTDSINATALCLKDAELAGFIKYDFLGIATLTVIHNTEKDVSYKFDYDKNNYDDKRVWDMIGSKNTTGLFQIGTKLYKDRMPRLRPRTIPELAACLALVRGPCISAKTDKLYMDILDGKAKIEKIHPFYDSVTERTNGILLFQEQLMFVAVNFGFSLEDSFKLMKLIAKKKVNKIKPYEKQFYELAEERNVSKEAADKVWKIFNDAGLYLFNESHAIAYATIVYCTAYLKTYYPIAFMKNTLTNAYLRKEEVEDMVKECRRIGIKILPLDYNISQYEFSLEDNCIRIGLCAIKSFGEGAAEELLEKRPFNDLNDFISRVEKSKCSKRAIVPAIFSGLFDDYNQDRKEVYEEFCEIRKEEPVDEIKLQGGSKFSIDDPYDVIETLLLGAPLISDAVNNFESIGFNSLKHNNKFTVQSVIRKVKKIKDKNKRNMAFLTLETADGYIECTMFADTYKEYKSFCKKDLICYVTAKKDSEDSCIAMSVA